MRICSHRTRTSVAIATVGTQHPEEYQPQLRTPRLQLWLCRGPGVAGETDSGVSTTEFGGTWVLKRQEEQSATSRFSRSCLSTYSGLDTRAPGSLPFSINANFESSQALPPRAP